MLAALSRWLVARQRLVLRLLFTYKTEAYMEMLSIFRQPHLRRVRQLAIRWQRLEEPLLSRSRSSGFWALPRGPPPDQFCNTQASKQASGPATSWAPSPPSDSSCTCTIPFSELLGDVIRVCRVCWVWGCWLSDCLFWWGGCAVGVLDWVLFVLELASKYPC